MRALKIVFIFVFSCLLTPFLFAETVELSGKQTKQGQFSAAKLESEPTELTSGGKIIEVKGGYRGFWINRKDGYRVENVYKFWNPDDAIGKKLSPGTYTVYPNLDKNDQEARVVVCLESEVNFGIDIPLKSSAIDQYSYVADKFYDKIASASGEKKIHLLKGAIQGFAMVINKFDDPKAKTTKKISAYYQAQCYREWGDKANYKRSLEKCLEFVPDIDEKNESTISYMRSIHIAAKKELAEVQK